MTHTRDLPWITIWVCTDFYTLPVDVLNAVIRAECGDSGVEA